MNSLVQTDTKPLRAFSMDEAHKPLLVLFAAYDPPYADRNAEKATALMDARINAYLLGLDGLPGWAVAEAVTGFIQGRIERPAGKLGKLPVVEELAREARRIRDEEGRRQTSRRAALPEPEFSPSEGETHRMRLKMALWRHACGATAMMDDLLAATNAGLLALVRLADAWGVPVADEIRQMVEEE